MRRSTLRTPVAVVSAATSAEDFGGMDPLIEAAQVEGTLDDIGGLDDIGLDRFVHRHRHRHRRRATARWCVCPS